MHFNQVRLYIVKYFITKDVITNCCIDERKLMN